MAEMTMLTRALHILQRLATHQHVTVKDLYDIMERRESKQTIHRTIRQMQAAGIPIVEEAGPHNEKFYSIDRAFRLAPVLLSPEEVLAAALLLQFREVFAGTRIEEDIVGVFEKLHQLLPRDTIAVPDAFTGELLHIHQPGSLDLHDRGDILRDLFRGIVERRAVRVQYRRKRYTLHPYSLLLHNGALYVIGRVPPHTDTIYLALPRFRGAELTDDVFDRDPEYSLTAVLRDSFGIWYEEPVQVVIRFDPTVRESIESRRWHPTQQMADDEDGNLVLRMQLGPSRELIAWILRWGEFAEVLEPESLRKEMLRSIRAMRRLYRRPAQPHGCGFL